MKGVDLRIVGELLGHLSSQKTMHYAHLAADHKRNAVARLDKLDAGSVLQVGELSCIIRNVVVHMREWRNWQTHLV